MDAFSSGLALVLQTDVLLTIAASALFGLFVGIVPGLSATMAVALLVPITFSMSPVAALAAIITCAAMSIFAGDVPGGYLRIPGTPASAAYTNDMADLVTEGRLGDSLGLSAFASVVGGIFGTVVLIFGAPLLAEFALNFSSFEYFWLALLGLSAATLVAGDDALKGVIALMMGLFLAAVGLDFVTGVQRYTFGNMNLQAGIGLISVMIGAFALAELFRRAVVFNIATPKPWIKAKGRAWPSRKTIWQQKGHMARGGVLGTMLGVIPGAGADIASWVSYAVTKKFARDPKKFGHGSVEGVAGASAANNASLSGSYVPTLVFGIPGDSITAIVVGVLILKGIQPGPLVFVNSADMVNALYIVFIVANLLLLPLGIVAIYLGRAAVAIRDGILYPVILLLCLFGAFAITNNMFELWVVLGSGLLVWYMNENGYPAAPLILGLVLGKLVEQNFMSALIQANGRWEAFFNRPIGGTLAVITILVLTVPLLKWAWRTFGTRQRSSH